MPDAKISALTAATAPLGSTDAFLMVQGGANKKATAAQIAAFAEGYSQTSVRSTLRRLSEIARAGNPRNRPVMASPPTITASATLDAGLTNIYTYGSVRESVFSGTGGYIEPTFTTFARFRSTIVSGVPASHTWRVEFLVDAAIFEVRIYATLSTQRFRVIVDGQYADLTGIAAATLNVRNVVRLDFSAVGGRALRHIVVEGENVALFEGVAVGPTSGVYRSRTASPRLYVQGDSFAASAAATRAHDGLAHITADWLGIRDIQCGAIGGTGWLNPGTGQTTFRQRNSALIAAAPDLVIIAGGHNDRAYATAAVTTEVATWIAETRAALPNCWFIVMGAWPGDWGPSVEMIATENAIAAGVAAAGDSNTNFIPVSTDPGGSWFTGTGNTGATTGVGNSDLYTSTDAVHPNTAGHAFLGRLTTNAIMALL